MQAPRHQPQLPRLNMSYLAFGKILWLCVDCWKFRVINLSCIRVPQISPAWHAQIFGSTTRQTFPEVFAATLLPLGSFKVMGLFKPPCKYTLLRLAPSETNPCAATYC